MSTKRIISEESRRGPTIRQRLAAGVLVLALGFTSACDLFNREYVRAERDASVDAVADVYDGGVQDGPLPAAGLDADLDASLEAGVEPADDAPSPQPAQEPEQAGNGNGCLETRFNMHYNSTNFIDENSPGDIADFIRDVVRQGHDTVYIAGFASVENRGDRINNDAPYNRWLATQRANRVMSIVRDVVRHDGLELTVNVTGAYAETDEFGAALADNRSVVLTTRALPDPDSHSEVAEQIRTHAPNSVYDVSCEVPEQEFAEVEQAPTPAPRHQPRAVRRHTPAHQSIEDIVNNAGVIPALAASYEMMGVQHPAQAPAPAVQPAQLQPVVTTDDGIPIYFGIDPLPPGRTVAPDGFVESGPAYVAPEPITPERQAEPPAEPQPAIPPASIRGSDVTSMYDTTQAIEITDKDVQYIQQRATRTTDRLADSRAPHTVEDALNDLYRSLRALDDAAAGFRSTPTYERTSYLG